MLIADNNVRRVMPDFPVHGHICKLRVEKGCWVWTGCYLSSMNKIYFKFKRIHEATIGLIMIFIALPQPNSLFTDQRVYKEAK